jgi:hypothetical protein
VRIIRNKGYVLFEIKGTDCSKLRVRIVRARAGTASRRAPSRARARAATAAARFPMRLRANTHTHARTDTTEPPEPNGWAHRRNKHPYKTKQNNTKQHKTKQHKTTQNKTTQNNTKQNKPAESTPTRGRCALAHPPRASGARRVLDAGTRPRLPRLPRGSHSPAQRSPASSRACNAARCNLTRGCNAACCNLYN